MAACDPWPSTPTPAVGTVLPLTAPDDDNLPILRSRSYSAPNLAHLPSPPVPSTPMPMPMLVHPNQPPHRPSVPPRPQSSFADAIVMARARHRAHSIVLPPSATVPSPAESLRYQRDRKSVASSGFNTDSDDEQSDLSSSTESTTTSTHGLCENGDGDPAAKKPSWEPVLTEHRLDRFMKALDELLVMSSSDVHAILPRFPGYEGASLDRETPAYGPANPAVEERVHEALFPPRAVDPWIDDSFDDEALIMAPPSGPYSASKRANRRSRSRTYRTFTPARRPSDSGVSMTSSADADDNRNLPLPDSDFADDDDEDIPLAALHCRRKSAPHSSTAHLVARALLSRTTRSHSLPHLTSTYSLAIPRVATPVTGPVAFASPDVKRTPTLRRRVSVRGRRTAKQRASYALFGTAEVVYQRRTYQWVVEPVAGGVGEEVEVRSVAAQVMGLNAPPRPWDIKLEGMEEGGEGTVSVEVPRTAVVMPCHVCAQQGHVVCPTCTSPPLLTHPPPITHPPCTTRRGTHHVPCAICQSHRVLRLFLVVTATWTRRTATLANTGGARSVPVTSLATAPALIDVENLADLPASTQGPDVARVRGDVESLLDALMAEARPKGGVDGVVVEKVGYRLRAVPVDQVQVTRRRWFHSDTVESYVQVGEHQVEV